MLKVQIGAGLVHADAFDTPGRIGTTVHHCTPISQVTGNVVRLYRDRLDDRATFTADDGLNDKCFGRG